MTGTRSVFKWWWGWAPDKIEVWLEDMEARGWNLVHMDLFATRFFFNKGVSKKVRYCVDYQVNLEEGYANLLEEVGWHCVYSGAGWTIWRMEYNDKRPDLYTDPHSLIARNNRVLAILVGLSVVQLPLVFSIFHNSGGSFVALLLLYGPVILFFIYCLVKLLRANQKLKA